MNPILLDDSILEKNNEKKTEKKFQIVHDLDVMERDICQLYDDENVLLIRELVEKWINKTSHAIKFCIYGYNSQIYKF